MEHPSPLLGHQNLAFRGRLPLNKEVLFSNNKKQDMDHPGRGKRLHLKFCVDNGTAIAHHKVVARANELRAGLHFVYGKRATEKNRRRNNTRLCLPDSLSISDRINSGMHKQFATLLYCISKHAPSS